MADPENAAMRAYPYTNAAVRDLAWACFEPAMIRWQTPDQGSAVVRNCALQLNPARLDWLRTLDQHPQPLLDYLAGIRSRRLGLYFEALWHFFLQQDPSIDLVAHNLPVRDGGITLGEFDCIYFCHDRQRHIHLELAVKYFLGIRNELPTATTSHWHDWWGPECQDRLDLKLEHLLEHQIRLADTEPGQACLAEYGVTEVGREVEVKGHLFESAQAPLPAPPYYNRDRPLSSWLPISDLEGYCQRPNRPTYLVLPKSQWLAPAAAGSDGARLTAVELNKTLRAHFQNQLRPQLVAALDRHGFEVTRFFVVDDNWPDTESAMSAQRKRR